MTKNKNEYTDLKNVRHTVKHLILSSADQVSKAQILEEIRDILMKQKKSAENTA
ncbi:MAG: hypothetical protein IJY35_13040 [Clostridia bacterium]|nr:hypothetical protein [Clostridia bacterium]